jgi:dCMP deaminase
MLIQIALITSQRSTCERLQVGAVIAKDGRIISTGYAGAPSGLPHCGPEVCDTNTPCTRTVHAEAGAISYAARMGIPTTSATLYCTHSPCIDCAKLIINSGIARVVYYNEYRKPDGILLLESAGIIVEKFYEES